MPRLEVIRNAGPIEGVANLLTKVRDLRGQSPTGAVWLRGLENETYSLLPSIGRLQKFAGKKTTFNSNIEWQLLHRFRRYAYEFIGRELTGRRSLLLVIMAFPFDCSTGRRVH
jgi:hypothetical protein